MSKTYRLKSFLVPTVTWKPLQAGQFCCVSLEEEDDDDDMQCFICLSDGCKAEIVDVPCDSC